MGKIPDKNQEQALLARFGQTSTRESAFSELVAAYQEKIYWQVRRMINDHETCNDLVQEIFIRIWENLDKFRGDSRLSTWLFRITHNEILRHLEKQNRRHTESLDDEEKYIPEPGHEGTELDAQRINHLLEKAMETLPDKQKQVFALRYFDEMPYQEMAQVLETSEGALKASYHHAYKKIETYLREALNL